MKWRKDEGGEGGRVGEEEVRERTEERRTEEKIGILSSTPSPPVGI